MSKVVFITGASSGIGKAIGEFLLVKGFKVYGTSRNPENVKQSSIELVALDVRNVASIQTAIQTVLDKEGKIDVLVNNTDNFHFNICRGRNYFGGVTQFHKKYKLLTDDGVANPKNSKWYYDNVNKIIKIFIY